MPRVFRKNSILKTALCIYRIFFLNCRVTCDWTKRNTKGTEKKKGGGEWEGLICINPILSKDECFCYLNDTCQELLKQIGKRIGQ